MKTDGWFDNQMHSVISVTYHVQYVVRDANVIKTEEIKRPEVCSRERGRTMTLTRNR